MNIVRAGKDKRILGGKPRIPGTRISIDIISAYISSDKGIDEIKRDYPHLSDEQIAFALNYLEKQACKERGKLEYKTAQV